MEPEPTTDITTTGEVIEHYDIWTGVEGLPFVNESRSAGTIEIRNSSKPLSIIDALFEAGHISSTEGPWEVDGDDQTIYVDGPWSEGATLCPYFTLCLKRPDDGD